MTVRDPIEEAGPEPPPCERHYGPGRIHLHPRYPSGWCVECGAPPECACRAREYDGWEEWQTSS
jgi:hypothetical protein